MTLFPIKFMANFSFSSIYSIQNEMPELIHYNRAEVVGPKLSTCHKLELEKPQIMERILSESNGRRGEIKKKRVLFFHRSTRINLDEVEDLGHFIELEASLTSNQSEADGINVIKNLMKIFEIDHDNLIEGAYLEYKGQ